LELENEIQKFKLEKAKVTSL